MSNSQHSCLTLLAALWIATSALGEPAAAWAERDTRMANEYLSLLVDQPEYGRVVDLLWALYQKRDATKLLLDNIHAQAATSKHPSVLLVEAHLVRKSGDLRRAAALYDGVLKLNPGNVLATRARADVANELGDSAGALVLLQKLASALPDTDPAKIETWMALGNLALAGDKPDEAARAWEAAAKLKPLDMNLARNVAQLMLRAGHPERAASFLEALTHQDNPQKKLDALFDLARVYEHGDQYAKADQTLRAGLSMLDFRDTRYAEFFQRLVRLHEQFGGLDELRNQLRNTYRQQPTEQALYDLARFYKLTVDPDERVAALRELVKAAPNNDQYRWELVRSLLDHDGAAEAARLLDDKLSDASFQIPALVQMRAEADLRQGHQSEAIARLTKLIDSRTLDANTEKLLLTFAQERSLDAIVETLLKRRVQRDPGKPEPAFELATFYRTRDRTEAAVLVLRNYAMNSPTLKETARRMSDGAQFLATGGASGEALALQKEAVVNSGGMREDLVRLADLLAEAGKPAEAVHQLEAAHRQCKTTEETADVDDRLFSVLQGDRTEKVVKKSAATSTGFQLPAFMTGQGFGSDEPAESKARTQFPGALIEYATQIISEAKQPAAKEREHTRGLWWAFHIERTDECYVLLRRILCGPHARAPQTLPVELQRLILDIGISDENRLLSHRLLRTLVESDPANRVQYLLRLAEQNLADNQPDLAVKPLERALKEQPDNANVLEALTQCHQLLRKPETALALWREAISHTPGNGGTPLRERYADLLLKSNKLADYVETEVAIVEAETDIKRRREAFKRFLDRLAWSDASGGEVAPDVLQNRLKLVEKRVLECTRRHPFDGFFHEALAAVFEKRGDPVKAFASMKQAYYTSPDTPFSLDQLRTAALAVNDLKSAIYFQKQIAAAAPPKELANESRQLIQLLEQTFQIAEADKVRRQLENRLSQDATALEDLAQYYKETGQDEAERRVYEQIQRVRSWDARSTLRLALKCIAVADEPAAEKHLRDLLAKTQSRNSLRALPPDRWPFPLTDERKPGAASLSELTGLLDELHGLEKPEQDRLRSFLNVPRPELAELPDDPSLVRLRGIEELAKLLRRRGSDEPLNEWVRNWTSNDQAPPVEKLWALFHSGANKEFQMLVALSIGEAESIELQFVYAWLTVRAQGMSKALEWIEVPKIGDEKQRQRKRLLQCACGMLAEWDRFNYAPAELAVLGNSRLLHPTAMLDIVRRLQDRQRYDEAITLVECIRSGSPDMWRYYTFVLASFAQSAEQWDRQRQYLHEVLAQDPQPGGYSGEVEDPFLLSVVALHRLARTPQERDSMLRQALDKLRATPSSPLTLMRRAAVEGLAGAAEPAQESMQRYIGGSFLSARTFGIPYGGLMPQGSVRTEEANFLRTYWEDLRMVGAILAQQGLGNVIASVDDYLAGQIGSVQLGPKTSDTFSLWRSTRLVHQMRETNFPNRRRLVREHLGSVDLHEEDAVETLTELGRELEVNGLVRECIDIYKQLPGRAPTNNLYAEYFIRVCEQSWEPRPGREYVESLFGRDPLYKPQGIGDEVLREKHARFLALEFDVERLRQLAWHPEGFSHVLKGRIAHEVPYAHELALLLEHMGDLAGAALAWDQAHNALVNGTPDEPFPMEPETELHRARLLEAKGDHERALAVLRDLPVKDALDETRVQALQLRVQVAATAGRWEEVHELMSLAVDKKSPEIVLAITEQLRAANRPAEALNFLTQAERAIKGGDERFVLRLEQLRFLALDKTWNPVAGRAQISALFRTGGRKREPLQRMTGWFADQARSPAADQWIAVLRAETRSSRDPTLAALALCALAPQLHGSALPAELSSAWARAGEKDRPCLELAAATLLQHGRCDWAWSACEALRATPAGLQTKLLPIAAKVAGAMKDEIRLRELYAEIVRMPFPGGSKTTEWAEAFESAGHPGWAGELYDLADQQMQKTQKPNIEIIQAHIAFLIRSKNFETAESMLMKHYYSFIPQTSGLVVNLYREWNRLDQLDQELPKFYLPLGVEKEVRFQAWH